MVPQIIIKRLVLLPLLSLALTACDQNGFLSPETDQEVVTTSAPKGKQVALPFHGSTTGMLVGQSFPAPEGRCPPQRPIFAQYQGSGTATHLGRFTIEGGECMFFDPNNPTSLSGGEGRYRLTAANGDWIDVTYTGLSTLWFESPTSPWIRWQVGLQVEEGSGRFEEAEFVGVIFAGGYNAVTQETYSELDGKIIYHPSRRSR